jgi:acyl-CoA thioester hydrolase
MSEKKMLVHVERIPIRWGDMDAMGHVNNTVYFRYMEQARISWFNALGVTAGPEGEGPVIVNASCTFKRPFTYPGTVEVRTYAGKPGGSSIPTYIEMALEEDPATVYAEGAAVVVWMDFPNHKPIRVPDSIRALLPK